MEITETPWNRTLCLSVQWSCVVTAEPWFSLLFESGGPNFTFLSISFSWPWPWTVTSALWGPLSWQCGGRGVASWHMLQGARIAPPWRVTSKERCWACLVPLKVTESKLGIASQSRQPRSRPAGDTGPVSALAGLCISGGLVRGSVGLVEEWRVHSFIQVYFEWSVPLAFK